MDGGSGRRCGRQDWWSPHSPARRSRSEGGRAGCHSDVRLVPIVGRGRRTAPKPEWRQSALPPYNVASKSRPQGQPARSAVSTGSRRRTRFTMVWTTVIAVVNAPKTGQARWLNAEVRSHEPSLRFPVIRMSEGASALVPNRGQPWNCIELNSITCSTPESSSAPWRTICNQPQPAPDCLTRCRNGCMSRGLLPEPLELTSRHQIVASCLR